MSRDDEQPRSPYAVRLDDLEAEVRVPLEDHVEEQDLDPPGAVSEAEVQRNQVLRTIAQGG